MSWFWNGWGRLARRDVEIHHEPESWAVEARQGGPEGDARFGASGGDWGGQITDLLGAQAPTGLIGIHTNFPGAVRADVAAAVQSGAAAPSGLDDEETRLFDKLKEFFTTDVFYAFEMATHPQALYGVADSPVGLTAWLLDHDATSLALISRVFNGQTEGLTRDDILDNITYYWLTNTGAATTLFRRGSYGFRSLR